MKKIKILTITTSGLYKKEGISTIILDDYSFFDKSKFKIDIIAAGDYGYELISEFQTIGVNIRFLPSRKTNVINYIVSYIKLLKESRYDALYIHGSSAIMTIELIIAKMCGVKVRIVHSHNTACEHKIVDKLLRPLFYMSYTKALACGRRAGEWLYGKREFQIVRNGRDMEIYRFRDEVRQQLRNKLDIDKDTLVIGHVGNFNKQKNQEFLVRVYQEVVRKKENSKLYLMGSGCNEDNVKNLVKELGLEEKVFFTGSINNVPELLQAMDVMVLPSLHEGLPLVVIEWQIAALPCLLSDEITKESAYTDLVHFLPLSCTYTDWADKVIEISLLERCNIANEILQATCVQGYDIQTNAKQLQQLFEEECRK